MHSLTKKISLCIFLALSIAGFGATGFADEKSSKLFMPHLPETKSERLSIEKGSFVDIEIGSQIKDVSIGDPKNYWR